MFLFLIDINEECSALISCKNEKSCLDMQKKCTCKCFCKNPSSSYKQSAKDVNVNTKFAKHFLKMVL